MVAPKWPLDENEDKELKSISLSSKTRPRTQVSRLPLQCSLKFPQMERNYHEATMSYHVYSFSLGLPQWCAGKYLISSSLGNKQTNKKPWLVAFAIFRSVNSPIMADFKMPMWCPWTELWAIQHTIIPSTVEEEFQKSNLIGSFQFSLRSMSPPSKKAQSGKAADHRRGKSVHDGLWCQNRPIRQCH